ncbi:MAG: hypothetical protein IPF57_03980 [Gammaproteobacteria bacterium]|nr:hypothetical protein [Gammaproteobacteria bacterium]
MQERPVTVYAVSGTSSAFPDYWEIISDKESATSLSAFETGSGEEHPARRRPDPARRARSSTSVSLFYNDIEDYIPDRVERQERHAHGHHRAQRRCHHRGAEAGLS